MKRLIISLTLLALFALSVPAMAQAPELRGTWKGDSLVHMPDGVRKGICAFVINVQEGSQFRGFKLWFDQKQVLQREQFVGIYDDGRLIIAEKDDGNGFGYLTTKQSMTINYVEGGAIAKSIIYDLERVRFTSGFVEIDKNGDNLIMRAEVTNHYPLNADRIIKEADTNKDGKLTKKEWDKWREKNN